MAGDSRFSSLLLEGLDHYRHGKMLEAVRAWEAAYLLEPTNLRAREFLRSALERIHGRMAELGGSALPGVSFSDVPPAAPAGPFTSGPGVAFRSMERHPWLRGPGQTSAPGSLPPAPGAAARMVRASSPGVPKQPPPTLPPPLAPRTAPAPQPAATRPPPAPGARTTPMFASPPRQPPPPVETDPELAKLGAEPAAPAVQAGAIAPGAIAPGAIARPPAPTAEPSRPPAATPAIWKLHQPPPPPAESASDETEIWMTAAGELLALDDFSGALELAAKVLAREPKHAGARAVRDTCEQNLLQMYESRLGATTRCPRVLLGPDEVIWLNLDPRAGFVLAQIDGSVSFEDLYAICGLSHLDTARILNQLLEAGVIATEGGRNKLF